MNEDTNNKLSYDKLLEHYDFTLGLWCIDRNPNEVDIDWIRQNAFQPKPIDNNPNFNSVESDGIMMQVD